MSHFPAPRAARLRRLALLSLAAPLAAHAAPTALQLASGDAPVRAASSSPPAMSPAPSAATATAAAAAAAPQPVDLPGVSRGVSTWRQPVGERLPAGHAQATHVGPPRRLTIGEVSTIELPSVARIAIGNGGVVKATVVDGRQIVLLAEAVGQTTLYVWQKDGRQVAFDIDVHQAGNARLLADLQDFLKEVPAVKARLLDDRILLEGRYPDSETAQKIKRLVASFPQILNLVPDRPADADPLQMERMVELDLRLVEADKRAVDQLGINWATTANGPTVATNLLGYANTPWRPDNTVGFPPVSTLHPAATYLGLATQITSALNFLEEKGKAWTVAEPHLSCKSGGESKFLAGGEIPIPVPQGNGAIGVEYKQYGVVINFKPVADGQGNIESGVTIEVSQPDPRNSNMGFVAFTTNRAETEVAVKAGEPMVIAGLLKETLDKSSDALPGLGHLPFLGYLFGEKQSRAERTELFVIVTPHVVTPGMAASDPRLGQADKVREDAREQVQRHLESMTPDPTPPAPPASAPAADRVPPHLSELN